MKELSPGTSKIGFLVKNYPYGLIPRSKLANPDQNVKNFGQLIRKILDTNLDLKGGRTWGGHPPQPL